MINQDGTLTTCRRVTIQTNAYLNTRLVFSIYDAIDACVELLAICEQSYDPPAHKLVDRAMVDIVSALNEIEVGE